jgi:hypothetical protein
MEVPQEARFVVGIAVHFLCVECGGVLTLLDKYCNFKHSSIGTTVRE